MQAVGSPRVRSATPRIARTLNDRAALELLVQRGPLTAPMLRALTGMSRPSVSELLTRLQSAGLITVVGEAGTGRRGPNARLYMVSADCGHVAAVDVRADRVALAVADVLGDVVATGELPIGQTAEPRFLPEQITGSLTRALADANIHGAVSVTVGAPGSVDPATGMFRQAGEHPPWHTELVQRLTDAGHAVTVENEANLAGVAEHRLGAARQRDSFLLLWLSGSVGAAIVLGGQLWRGASAGAGEIGFLPVPGTDAAPNARRCTGGLHSIVGSAAVCSLARQHCILNPASADAEAAEAAVLAAHDAADNGQAFLNDLAYRIALGAAAVCATIDPGLVVLAGEIGRAGGAALAQRVSDHLAVLSPLPTEVSTTAVPEAPILTGGILTALDAVRDELFTTG